VRSPSRARHRGEVTVTLRRFLPLGRYRVEAVAKDVDGEAVSTRKILAIRVHVAERITPHVCIHILLLRIDQFFLHDVDGVPAGKSALR
jgi:hypothetical protein